MYRQRSSKCKAFCIKIKPYTRFYKAHDEYKKKISCPLFCNETGCCVSLIIGERYISSKLKNFDGG